MRKLSVAETLSLIGHHADCLAEAPMGQRIGEAKLEMLQRLERLNELVRSLPEKDEVEVVFEPEERTVQ